jgi:predicted sulfurtransferase
LEEQMPGGKVATLRGGIAGYLMWMEGEITSGRKGPEESLFKGKNFVFDGRGSTTLGDEGGEPVAKCHVCGVAEDRLSKCRSKGCHLVLVVCAECEMEEDPRCCQSCLDMDVLALAEGEVKEKSGPRPICACEKEREAELWGGEYVKPPKIQKSRKAKKNGVIGADEIDIRVKVID